MLEIRPRKDCEVLKYSFIVDEYERKTASQIISRASVRPQKLYWISPLLFIIFQEIRPRKDCEICLEFVRNNSLLFHKSPRSLFTICKLTLSWSRSTSNCH